MRKLLLSIALLWAAPAVAQVAQVPTVLSNDCSGSGITSIVVRCPRSVMTSISAAGTTQATATALTTKVNVVSTVASGSGVSLPAYDPIAGGAQTFDVINTGANALLVYPTTASGQIWPLNGATAPGAAGTSVSLAVGTRASFLCVSSTLCYEGP